MSLKIMLNGQPRQFETLDRSATLAQLVSELGLKPDRIAVELNGQIVSRSSWSESTLRGDDRIEIVHFVGGGSAGQSQ